MLLRFSSIFCASALLFSACSKQNEAASVPEIRGEPIRGEKIAKSPANAASTEGMKVCDAPLPKRIAERKPSFQEVSFDKLAGYTFEVPDGIIATNEIGKSESQIPKDVKAYDQKKVALKGFMLPLKVDNGLVTELLIMKDQSMCCYGAVPRINDWVSVKMKNGGVKSIMDEAVTIYGKMRVGEMLENGYLVGIYELDGEKMDELK
jgi:hypothetical protein